MGIPVPISAHNEPLVGDTLTTVQFNYEWRRLIVELLFTMCFDTFWTGAQADIEAAVNNAAAMIEDIYTEYPMQKIAARLRESTTPQLIPINTQTLVVFADPALSSDMYDYGGFYDSSAPDTITIPANLGGVYHFSARVAYLASTPNILRSTLLLKNGVSWIAGQRKITNAGFDTTISGDAELVAGDTVQMIVFSGAADFLLVILTFHRVFN